ncbi:hypothetical protein ALC57_05905 [Trachymyrmex cornetzi]|uniref:Uncharacterized protein n=1 Tax=Trachymyrmex cornetzi TaxID=471704 RepID=A0A151J9S7_9HYME|nr:hypothetical protein ALC57_05905 [Trachymyrmex cornetzi]
MRKRILDIPKTIIRNENRTSGKLKYGGISNDEKSRVFQKKTRHIVGEVFGKFKRVRGEENEQSGQEGTRKNERTRTRTVIALVMPDAEEKSGVEWASGRLRYQERNKFSCKANVDYPTVNVRGNYISQEEADCYCSYLRPSTTGSLGTSRGLARHKLHGQAGATARI